MNRIIILLLILACISFNICYYIKKKKYKRQKYYKTPKLSSLKGKKFKEYIDNLTKNL